MNTHPLPSNTHRTGPTNTNMNAYSVVAAAATGLPVCPSALNKVYPMQSGDVDDDVLLALYDRLDEQKRNGQGLGQQQQQQQQHLGANHINSNAIATPKRPYYDQGQGQGQGQDQGQGRPLQPVQMPPSPVTPLLQALRLSSPSSNSFALSLLPATSIRTNNNHAIALDPGDDHNPIAMEEEETTGFFADDAVAAPLDRDRRDQMGVEIDEVGVEIDEVGVDPVAELRFPLHDDDQVLSSSSDDDHEHDRDRGNGNDSDGFEGVAGQGDDCALGRKRQGKGRGKSRGKGRVRDMENGQAEIGEEEGEERGDSRMDVVDGRRGPSRSTRPCDATKSPYLQAYSPSQVVPLLQYLVVMGILIVICTLLLSTRCCDMHPVAIDILS